MTKLIAGLDIGNGYVKGSVYGNDFTRIDIPSSVAFLTDTNDMKETNVKDTMDDIFNQLDVSFQSHLVEDSTRRLFGTRGLMSGMPIDEFDVYSGVSKAHQSLAVILTLGCLAAKAMKDYYTEHKKLPEEVLKVNVRIALALPIDEFMKYRKEYANRYKEKNHIVEIHNFEQIVRVELHFEDVQVVAEGQAAQKAINAKGEEFMEAMLADIRRMGEPLEGITAKDVLAASNSIGVDIGEGTVNFPVYQNGKFNPDASFSLEKGYGDVLNRALSRLNSQGYAFSSRKELQDFLNRTPSKLNANRYKKVQDVVDSEITSFVTEVNLRFSQILKRVGTYTEVVFVYGGGATPVRNELYPMLIEKSKQFGGGELLCPILYLDSAYSRWLNNEGLYVIADVYAKKSK